MLQPGLSALSGVGGTGEVAFGAAAEVEWAPGPQKSAMVRLIELRLVPGPPTALAAQVLHAGESNVPENGRSATRLLTVTTQRHQFRLGSVHARDTVLV